MHIMEFHVEQIFFENGSKVYMYVALKGKNVFQDAVLGKILLEVLYVYCIQSLNTD